MKLLKILILLTFIIQMNKLSAQNNMFPVNTFRNIIDKRVDNKNIFGVVVNVSSGEDSWIGSSGNLTDQSQYFIASTTKLYITAIILQLRESGKLQLDDKISEYLPSDIIKGLQVYKGVDYSNDITIRHLLSQTSGLPDYFQQKKENGKSLLHEITSGNDQYWTFEDAINLSKKIKPKFRPGEKGKAFYSDTNFQLLGKIIETITGKTISQAFHEMIFEPLHLTKTYLYTDSKDTTPATMYYKRTTLPVPLAMTSFSADGGIVSTAEESMIFLKAFFTGELFPKAYLSEMKQWNSIFFPLEYGMGITRFKLPRIFSPFKPLPELIGHSGLSGAFSYYCPEKDVFITGTVNQINNPGIAYRLMVSILNNL